MEETLLNPQVYGRRRLLPIEGNLRESEGESTGEPDSDSGCLTADIGNDDS